MSGGLALAVTAKAGVSQWPEITSIAFGDAGREAGIEASQLAIFVQVSGGFQSIKKQGPPPCGKKIVGSFILLCPAILESVRSGPRLVSCSRRTRPPLAGLVQSLNCRLVKLQLGR